MNVANVDKAIAIMGRAVNLNMRFYQAKFHAGGSVSVLAALKTEEELHRCGTSACFGGYIAVSKEFQADGGFVSTDGSPCIVSSVSGRRLEGHEALAYWFVISETLAQMLVYGGTDEFGRGRFYGKPLKDVLAEDVIRVLQQIKSGELQ